MTISQEVVRKIVKKLLHAEDYRVEVIALIDAEFFQHTINFLKEVMDAKVASSGDEDWYKAKFLDLNLPKENIAHNSGLNMKTITNAFKTSSRTVVFNASQEHYDVIVGAFKDLSGKSGGLDLNLKLNVEDVDVNLTMAEALMVINALAVKRAAIRGGAWSSTGKRAEKPLMQVLCKLYGVAEHNFRIKFTRKKSLKKGEFEREIDFYLIDPAGVEHKCEVKLMGTGNPESADAFHARESKIFVADTLSQTNKNQMDAAGAQWVELRADKGFQRFEDVLKNLQIPYTRQFNDANFDDLVELYLSEIFESA